jgi:hypothetical protein
MLLKKKKTIISLLILLFFIMAMVFVAFCVLLCLEFITGVLASLKEGGKIESKKFGRFIFKVFIYTLMISVVHIMNINSDQAKAIIACKNGTKGFKTTNDFN